MHYDGWFWYYKTQDFYRWKDLPRDDGPLWGHFCTKDKSYLAIKIGESCSWCGKTEKSS